MLRIRAELERRLALRLQLQLRRLALLAPIDSNLTKKTNPDETIAADLACDTSDSE